MTKTANVDIPNMTRRLYQDFYGGGVMDAPAVENRNISSVKASELFLHADEEAAHNILNGVVNKKWSVVDEKSRLFKVHDSPHNYNVQVRAHRGKDAEDDKTLTAGKNVSKLAKFLLSGTRSVVLPIFNMEVDHLPSELSTKLKNLGVSVPRGSRYSVEFTERFFKSDSLRQYLRSGVSPSERKVLAYQVLSALDNCREQVAGFVHNNINPDTVTVYQLTPPLLRGGSTNSLRPSWRTEVRLSGLDKATFNKKTPVTADLEAVAALFQGNGGNPDGTTAFFKRVVKMDSYKEALADSYFAELKDAVSFTGGAPRTSKKASKSSASKKATSDAMTSSGTRQIAPIFLSPEAGATKQTERTGGKRADDSSTSSMGTSSLSTSSVSSSSPSPSSSSSSSPKKGKKNHRRRPAKMMQQQQPQHHHSALFNALNGDAFLRDPSSAIANPHDMNSAMMNTPFMQQPQGGPDGGYFQYPPVGQHQQMMHPQMMHQYPDAGQQMQYGNPNMANPLAGPVDPSMMMQAPSHQPIAMPGMGHYDPSAVMGNQGGVHPSMNNSGMPMADPTVSPMIPDVRNMYQQMQYQQPPVQMGGAPPPQQRRSDDFFF